MKAAQKSSAEVLILGAGMAGLAAARTLAERGVRVLVLEARHRIGGRIFTESTPTGVLIEHGAEFIHGRVPELWSLLEEAGLRTVERTGTILRQLDGSLGVEEEDRGEDFFSPLEQLADLPEPDRSFAGWLASSNVPARQRAMLTGYVEGFNAADARRISARSLGAQQRAEDATQGGRSWHLPGGYAQLPEFLAARARRAGAEIRLDSAVRDIRWRPREVVVSTDRGDLRAPRCIITLPLGVLQAANAGAPHCVRLEPEPKPLFEARRLAMGQVVRMTMVFRSRWWEQAPATAAIGARAAQTMSFLFTPERMPPVWWTRHPEFEPQPTLVGWSGGPRSRALRGKSAEELGELACRDLAEVFGASGEHVHAELIGVYTFDWNADPFARGAYGYVPEGALDAPEAMTIPEADTLFFAGEHTDTTAHWGTVHAALRTGLRAARQVLAAC